MANLKLETTKREPKTSVEGWSNPCVVPKMSRGQATVTLYHAMSPTCWWSWGYYGTLARVRLLYGDQVDMRLMVLPVYEDVQQYWKDYDLTPQKLEDWAKESAKVMGVPIRTDYARSSLPATALPPVLAVLAGYRQGQPQGDRLGRELARRFVVEGRDVNDPQELADAARAAGLDVARFQKDWKDQTGLRRDLEHQTHGLPHVQLGFYNVVLQDTKGRKVLLDHAFDPADVEGAIEFLSGGTLRKNEPTDPVEFLRATGAAPTVEIARAFGWSASATEQKLEGLERAGALARTTLAGATHWVAA